jgi:Zn-dependent protease
LCDDGSVPGGRSIQLARIFGIRIGANPSWFIVLFLIIWSLSNQYKDAFPGHDGKSFALATASALLFFGCVILHELGHALVAMRNRIQIAGIDLWLFGGIATLKEEPRTPGAAFRIVAAGPLVTAAIAGGCWLLGAAGWGLHSFWHAVVLDERFGYSAGEVLLGYLAFINTILLAFNLLPAFPLDGGNMVRAIAWWRTGDRLRATTIAARLGRLLGYAMAAGGVFVLLRYKSILGGIWFVILGNFLASAARSAEVQTRITSQLEGLSVADVMDEDPVAVPAETKLDRALDEFFLRYRWQWFPVIDRAGRFLGLVIREKVDEVPEDQRQDRAVDSVMSKDADGALRVRTDAPLEALLGSEGLRTLGALMAVDHEGILRGVVTLDQVRQALHTSVAT